MALPIDRRQFLSSTLPSSVIPSVTCAEQSDPKEETIVFFLVGDTHYFADKTEKTKIDERSKLVCGRLVDLLNKLPGQEIPKEAGGGKVLAVQGVLHAGDCIDSGDKSEVRVSGFV